MSSPCRTVQILEPDSTLLASTSSGSVDAALEELGEVILVSGQSEVDVTFEAVKLSDNYRFEYLYVDAFGIINPGTINPVPIRQTIYGFSVDLAGVPPVDGYILRWRAVVEGTVTPVQFDSPESIYEQLAAGSPVHSVVFSAPRSGQTYGFSELRVENLIDLPGNQTPILAQVVLKQTTGFTVALSPSPPNNNYNLVARTP